MQYSETERDGSLLSLVTFSLGGQSYALRLASVERLTRMVEVTPLPNAPPMVSGVINLQGRIVPVLNLRKRLSLTEREPNLNDHMIIARTSRRCVALVVDSVTGVIDQASAEFVSVDEIVPGVEYLDGVLKRDDGILFIHDLDRFLTLEEEARLDLACLKAAEPARNGEAADWR